MRAVNSNLKSNKQPNRTSPAVPVPNSATSRIGPFCCPVPGCPISNAKSWIAASSLHSHIREHCIGKFGGVIPNEY